MEFQLDNYISFYINNLHVIIKIYLTYVQTQTLNFCDKNKQIKAKEAVKNHNLI